VSFLKNVEWKNLRTIQRSRGGISIEIVLTAVGEPPLFLGSAVFFAIRDAINAARSDSGVGEILELFSPATPERIRLACEDEIVKRCIVKPKEGQKSFFVVI
jgi:xanthine dehydrogenase/oxidase